jgi:hypothetical protein
VKEALGGYLFFEAENLDAAIELSGQVTPGKHRRNELARWEKGEHEVSNLR